MAIEKINSIWIDPIRVRSKDPVFFDIGANDNTVAVDLLDRFGGNAIAYEPGLVVDKISKRSDLVICTKAINHKSGSCDFYDCPEQSQSSSLFLRKPKKGHVLKKDVECVSLGVALCGHTWIDFISIDIEGGEWDLLSHEDILNLRCVDQLCIEFHTEFSGGRTVEDMIKRLEDLAFFDCRIVEKNNTTRPIVLCIKRDISPREQNNKQLALLLKEKHFGKVLNLGCGADVDKYGKSYSKDYINANEIINCDLVGGPEVDIVASSEKMPFEDNSFDFVFCNVMIFRTDIIKTLKEIVRVLKSSGNVMLSYASPGTEKVKTITTVIKKFFDIQHEYSLTYVIARAVRLFTQVYGTLKPNTEKYFKCNIKAPVLVVVAHWDDETISLANILSKYGRGWAVVSVTYREQEPMYRKIFKGVGKDLGFNAVTLDIRQRERAINKGEGRQHYTRTTKHTYLDPQTVTAELKKKFGDLSRFKTVITHCETGDYGEHSQHIELAQTVKSIFKKTANVYSFNLKLGVSVFLLSEEDRQKKLALIRRYKPYFKLEQVPKEEFLLWA